MARRPRSRRRASSQDRWKLVIGSFLLIFTVGCIAVGVYTWFVIPRSPALDATTNCPIQGASALTVVLVDSSDDLPAAAKKEIEKILIDLSDQTSLYAHLEIRVLDPKLPSGRIIFSLCNPGSARNFDPLYGNPQKAEKRWKERFADPFTRAIPRALIPVTANSSPIMATIQGIALDRFTGQRVARLEKTLIVISDLIEHVPEYSQYKGEYNFQKFRESLHYRNTRTDLGSANVVLYYIDRPAMRSATTESHMQFWFSWIKDNDGARIDAKRLQGVR